MSKQKIGIHDILAFFEASHRHKVEAILKQHLTENGEAIRYIVGEHRTTLLSLHDLYYRLKGLRPRGSTYIGFDILKQALNQTQCDHTAVKAQYPSRAANHS